MEDLKGFEDITAEAFANFTTQQRLISVNVAGINARIEACNKILRRDALSPARIEQVETVKTSAEIELVGLAAKKAALEEIVTKGRKTPATRQAYQRRQQSIPAVRPGDILL